jgi:hypothetical protein
MDRLAEELGLVGGHRIDQVDRLGVQSVIVEQVAAVGVDAVHAASRMRRRRRPSSMVRLLAGILMPL